MGAQPLDVCARFNGTDPRIQTETGIAPRAARGIAPPNRGADHRIRGYRKVNKISNIQLLQRLT
jgi:hypothetical protein